jgi:BarA-like signal transduction histidine kinase
VKQWFVGTFGSAKPIGRWPSKMLKKDESLRKNRVAEITEAVFAKFPVVKSWGESLNGRTYSWADLMYLESAVMFTTMLDLMHQHQTPSLSVHDSLIVPLSKADLASEILKAKFEDQQKVVPRLKINVPI